MVAEHIIKSYDEELQRLDKTIAEMGGLAESQLAAAIEAVSKRDSDLAAASSRPTARSTSWSARSRRRSSGCWPCASRWRATFAQIVAALKTSTDLERICDYAANVAKRSMALNQTAPVQPVYRAAAHGAVARR